MSNNNNDNDNDNDNDASYEKHDNDDAEGDDDDDYIMKDGFYISPETAKRIIVYGGQDIYLTGTPDIEEFKRLYRLHTNGLALTDYIRKEKENENDVEHNNNNDKEIKKFRNEES